ncbi:DUF554 domain-containing protein [Verrucomicrobia bacterium]|nr:DUF554 domain-containing protein [Verrucomicrobiota bacterium]
MVAIFARSLQRPAHVIGLGTIVNVATILIGGTIGLIVHKQLSEKFQVGIRNFLGLLTFLVAISMIWAGVKKTDRHFSIIGISLLSLVLGNVVGKLIGIQRRLNKIGADATTRLSKAFQSNGKNFGEGFVTASLIYCVGPMAILGSIEDGVSGTFTILTIKAAMDGLASVAFASSFGVGVLFSAIPVGIYQFSITMAAAVLSGNLSDPMLASIGITGGMVVMTLPLIIMSIGKVPVSDYLPALAIAPLLTYWWIG